MQRLPERGSTRVGPAGSLIAQGTDGRYGPKGVEHEIAMAQRFREEWVRRDGRWLLRRSEALEGSMLIDGKPPAAKP